MNLLRRFVGASVLLVLLYCAAYSALAQEKVIKLRNERIVTPVPDRSGMLVAAQAEEPVSGLYLIQFTGPLQPGWQEQLSAMRVELATHVPDDAYVARLENTRLADLRALPQVRWVGAYRVEHKIFSTLDLWSRTVANLRQTAAVTILLSPTATDAQITEARLRLAQVSQQSKNRFGSVIRGQLAASQLKQLAQSSAVLWIEPAPKMKLVDEISSRIVAGDGPVHKTYTQELGFDGTGVTVAVADSGLHIGQSEGMHPDLLGRTPAFFHYGNLEDASDEHAHGTHVTGIIAGSGVIGTADDLGFLYGLGVAPGASIVTQRLFDGDGAYEAPPSFEVLTGDAVMAGAEIGSNSWGDDTHGRYDVSAAEFDALVRDAVTDSLMPGDQPYILEFSAGNAGPSPQTIGSPAVAKNVIATGASQNNRFDFFIYDEGQEAMADFSSRGPAEDGRIKPDVVAPGTWIASLRSPVGNDENAWLDIDNDYLYMGGTSQAGPQVSGAAAVFVQYYRERYGIGTPSPALVKAALIHSAVDMEDGSARPSPTPNMDEGWGRVDLTEIIGSVRWHDYLDQTSLLSQGQTFERSVIIANSDEPLRITMVYTDVPGFPGAIPALVNDLDLEMVGPDGRIYRGNQFESGESVPDASSADNINNVEGIYLSVPAPGEYMVRVRAKKIAQDARRDAAGINQDFALVISGNIPPPETGSILLDRTHYTAPGRIRVKVFDLDLAGVPSVNVTVRSATETNGLVLNLKPVNPSGVFTGTVATATGAAINDGLLQIAHGNWIRADYLDVSEQVTNSANATADLIAPVISAVAITNEFGQMIVSWNTDEPATGIVRFGTNSTLNGAVTNNFLTLGHKLELGELISGKTYYFAVISVDAAGNIRTNNNGGTLFSFTATSASTVLLVDDYVYEFGDPFIPLTSYTAALDQTGVSYDVWSTSSRGLPTFANLRPYQMVMWRLNDSINSPASTIPAAQRTAIQQYVNNGGGFFLSSMEILTRLIDGGGGSFVTNVLHIDSFVRADPFCFCHCTDCDEDTQVPVAESIASDVIGDGMVLTPNYTDYPPYEFFDLGPDFADTFGVATNATPFLFKQFTEKSCGVRFPRSGQDSTGRVVFISFPLDAIPMNDLAPNDRASFLRRVIQFLVPGLDGLATISLNREAYRLPDLAVVEIADSDLVGQTNAQARAYSTSFPTPISLQLQPTIRPSVFRAAIPLLPATAGPQAGKLRAANSDTIVVEFDDISGNTTIQATAVVDTVIPGISGLLIEPEFQDVTISWTTTERSDSLIQYGESTFLGRTAYLADLTTDHTIQFLGLEPDRLYYFKVVSRDWAGNAIEDDNGGQLHTFRTKKPVKPPFLEDLRYGGTNWSIFNGEDTQFGWTVGSPQNNHVANTPTLDALAWGSNLRGLPADSIDTFLVSPAIDLSGGNSAKLKFWHAYNFSERTPLDLLEGGEILIFTNTYSAPVTLAEYFDMNSGWEKTEINLTPYLGNVVFLVWHHQLLAFETAPRSGWVLDDISVTVTNIIPGNVTVENNISQAKAVLSGPSARGIAGYIGSFTNMLPGDYAITWSPVPYYNTPAPQTNELHPQSTLTFTGTYTFPDVNSNGMSDLWEEHFFGTIFYTRDCTTDTDGDGFPDCAEFAAGTNPTQPNSFLRLNPPVFQAPISKLLFQWVSSPGRSYRIQGSRDGAFWIPYSGWVRATTGTTTVLTRIPNEDDGDPILYRLEVQP